MKTKIIGVSFCMLLITAVFSGISYGSYKDTLSSFLGPTVEITSPINGDVVDDSHIIVEGYAIGDSIVKIEYTILYPGGGLFSQWYEIDPPEYEHSFSIPMDIVEGEEGNLITVTAVEIDNDEGYDSITVYYNPGGEDTEPPIVNIESPIDGMVYPYPREISLSGIVTDNVGVDKIGYLHEWSDDSYDTGYIQIPGGPVEYYEFYFDVELYPGINDLTVYAVDPAENQGEEEVEVTVQNPCEHRTPTLTDQTGNTTFHSVIVGCNHHNTPSELRGCQQTAQIMQSTLQQYEGWSYERMDLLYGHRATRDAVHNAINEAKQRAQPGDEFLFFFADHGGNRTIPDSSDDPDEPDGHDEHIMLRDGRVSDDELAQWLSGFRDCVTITVKLDCCHAGGFVDGDNDLQNATNADGELYGPDHINIEQACAQNETIAERPYFWNDTDGDYTVDPDELTPPNDRIWHDNNHNGRFDPEFDAITYWVDLNGNGEREDNENISSTDSRMKYLTDFFISNLQGLSNDNSLKNYTTTKADRNKDGITTTKELYEFSINYLHEWLEKDNDNDGLLNEDGYEIEENDDDIILLCIDNDNDGYFDEDAAPPSFAFWYDAKPAKPVKPTGKTNGNTNTVYTYSTSTTDPDADDVYYWFDWGDGTNSGWIGPYQSGEQIVSQHSWSEKGDYQIKVKSRDRCYAESQWSDPLQISMPKIKSINNLFLEFLQKHPLIYQLLQTYLEF